MPQGNNDKNVSYRPLTVTERGRWNDFLAFLHRRGYAGNPVLDDRSEDLSMRMMHEYNNGLVSRGTSPADTLSYDIVPRVQQDFQYFNENGRFPGYNHEEAGKFGPMIRQLVGRKQFSAVDNWLGSLTSLQAYPVIHDSSGKDWGTDYRSFFGAMRAKYPREFEEPVAVK